MGIDDIAVWACGTWCYGSEVSQMTHLSDDFYVLSHGTKEFFVFLKQEEGDCMHCRGTGYIENPLWMDDRDNVADVCFVCGGEG